MIDEIIKNYKFSTYDFREHACPEDPLSHLFDAWVDYYRMKWAISRTLKPSKILEIGVRYGYSARAFLDASPDALLIGIDADLPTFGGQPGAVEWAKQSLCECFDVRIIKEDSQKFNIFPHGFYDLVHIDGQQDGDGTFHDLDLAVFQTRYILVDGYHWTRNNFLAANEWLWLNKEAVQAAFILPGYAGELLILTKTEKFEIPEAVENSYAGLRRVFKNCLKNRIGSLKMLFADHRIADDRLQAMADIGMTVISRPRSVLGIGAGAGSLATFFERQGTKVTVVGDPVDAIDDADTVYGEVSNPALYDESYDLALAHGIVECLSPEENDLLYEMVSQRLKDKKGIFVVYSYSNLWQRLYEHSRQRKMAQKAGFWLPKIQRNCCERLVNVNEQNPRMLKKNLSRYFPNVIVWFADQQSLGGSLLERFSIKRMRCANGLFAVASHFRVEMELLKNAFMMPALSEREAKKVFWHIVESPSEVFKNEIFSISVLLNNWTDKRLSSSMPNPLHLSYHWLDGKGRRILCFDGLRSGLNPPLYSGLKAKYPVEIKAPAQVGRYRLRVLPVQENIRWHQPMDGSKDLIIHVRD